MMKLEDGRTLCFGECGAGPPVMLLHPIGLSGSCWSPLAAELAGHHRVLTPDLAGHGGTDAPAGPFTIEALADDVAELLRAETSEPAVTVGLSMGGVVALALAQRHPDLVGALVIINSAARVPDGFADAVRARADRTRAGGMAAVADETLARWFTPAFAAREPAAVAEIRRQLLAGDPEVHANAWLALAAADVEPGLASVRQPMLVVTGSQDLSVPAEIGARTASLAPNGRHVHLEGAGHMSPLEEPARLSATIRDFLATNGIR
ncbi:MAG: alpha/beta fold hydrolase [Actinomycetota bacterium]|jgi:3-oxoadipate enol-lactonase